MLFSGFRRSFARHFSLFFSQDFLSGSRRKFCRFLSSWKFARIENPRDLGLLFRPCLWICSRCRLLSWQRLYLGKNTYRVLGVFFLAGILCWYPRRIVSVLLSTGRFIIMCICPGSSGPSSAFFRSVLEKGDFPVDRLCCWRVSFRRISSYSEIISFFAILASIFRIVLVSLWAGEFPSLNSPGQQKYPIFLEKFQTICFAWSDLRWILSAVVQSASEHLHRSSILH